MNDVARKIIGNRWLTCVSRAVLGSILIIAAINKLQEHATFTNTVIAYDMLPDFLARAYGFILPWTELFIGCCLILGVFVRFASLLSIPIIFTFIVANVHGLVYTTAPEICGCLGKLVTLSHPVSLVIDIVMLILAGQIWLNNRSGEFMSIGPLIQRLGIASGGARRFLFEKGSMIAVLVLAMTLLACFSPDMQGETASTTLSISIDTAIGGSVTADPTADPENGTYEYGTKVTLTAVPADGYNFSYWDGVSGDTTTATIIITMNSDMDVTAHFTAIDMYNLTTAVDPSGAGTVDISPEQGSYAPGTEVALTALPETGYSFSHWDGVSGDTTTAAVTITMNSDMDVTAYFVPSNVTLTVTPFPAGWGTVTYPSGPYEYGDKVTLTANPATGYVFDHWSGNAQGNISQVTITMNSDIEITAHFYANLSVGVITADKGTVEISTSQGSYTTRNSRTLTYAQGTLVTLTISLDSPSYTFEGWWMGGQKLEYDEEEPYPITITMDSAKTIIAKIYCG